MSNPQKTSFFSRGLVSSIIPVYNRSDLLREAVASVLCQDYRPIEIIIVDDGSTESAATLEIARLVSANADLVHSIRVPNRGPGLARQAGLEIARGEYIQFLDSDDLLLPEKFSRQVSGLKAQPECVLSYGKTREYVIGEPIEAVAARRTGEVYGRIFPACLDGRIWATETPLFRRVTLDRIGPWSSLRVLEDWEYECRLGAMNAELHYCDAFVSDHRHHEGAREGLRWQTDDRAFKDMLTAHEKILGYARDARVDSSAPEMKRYARNLFRLARDAGKRGLAADAGLLLKLAAEVDSGNQFEYRVFDLFSTLVGWRRASIWSEKIAGSNDSPSRLSH